MPKEYVPEWAEKLENWGEKQGRKCDDKGKSRRSEYVANIIINIILIFLWHRLPEWLPFITSSFAAVLPIFYIAFSATIIGNLILLGYDGHAFRHFIKVVINIINLVNIIALYYVYPFNFTIYTEANWEQIAHILLIIGIIGTAISVLVELIQGIFSMGGKNESE